MAGVIPAAKAKPKPKKSSQPTLQQLEDAAKGINLGIGSGTGTGTSQTPGQLGLTAAQASAPVIFSVPGGKEEFSTPEGVTLNAKGQLVGSVAQVMEAYFKLNKEQLKFFQDQMVNAHILSSAKYATGEPNKETQDAWKLVAIDAANSGTSFSSLINMGASVGDYSTMLAGIESDIATEQRQEAEVKTGTYTETDPNEVRQSLYAAAASIGEPPPSPALADAFVNAFHNQEGAAEQSDLATTKQDYSSALTTLEGERNAVEAGNPGELNKLQNFQGPTFAVGKPTPNLDAESMAEAKAMNPAEYYATQSSYLYGLLLDDIRGTPSYQKAPTAPSATAPGGADLGTPLVPVGG